MPNLSMNCHQKRESGEKNAITRFAGPYICHLTIVVIKNKKLIATKGGVLCDLLRRSGEALRSFSTSHVRFDTFSR